MLMARRCKIGSRRTRAPAALIMRPFRPPFFTMPTATTPTVALLRLLAAACLSCCALAGTVHAASVVDDSGQRVTLAKPAQRVISLAPHVTALLFAAGGGERVVGVMNYSDYPEAARKIAVVGSSTQLDIERILALKPDLLVVWQSGNTARQLEQLRQLGIPLFYSEPTTLDQV